MMQEIFVVTFADLLGIALCVVVLLIGLPLYLLRRANAERMQSDRTTARNGKFSEIKVENEKSGRTQSERHHAEAGRVETEVGGG